MFLGSMEFYGVVHLNQEHTEYSQLILHLFHHSISKLHLLKLTFELHVVNLEIQTGTLALCKAQIPKHAASQI